MSVWATLAGAFIGTLVLTTVMRAGSELKLTRMDLPFLLGTAITVHRSRAKAIGYVMHFAFGQLFGLGYYAIFAATHHAGAVLGALLGLAHGMFAGTALVSILLPVVHPRMGKATTSAPDVALLEPPGFIMLNYGVSTPAVALLAHTAYGAIVGATTALAI
ncbi:hypothetical protein [Mycobacterium sp.]|uniref:hypothetical protein n=1 Tax=Mycobacterium sp. TaxID=1785 RepID=UPI00127705AE|nr:hypothetical protein [Mycobacterium sp.]KAA8962461.1 MAG: hypothetical protein F6Q13_12320 [Mycobacterium sp.]